MKRLIALGLLLAAWHPGARAENSDPKTPVARINIPYELEVERINDEPAAITRRAKRAGHPLELPPGQHTLVLRYYMPRGFDDADPLDDTPERSAPASLTIEVRADHAYQIAYTWKGRDTLIPHLLDAEGLDIPPPPPAQTPLPQPLPDTATQPAKEIAPPSDTALTALQQAWQEANAEERRAFRRWIIDAP
jgi:hypothetical protein